MRTILIILGGLVLLGLFLLGGRWSGGAGTMVTAAKVFIPIWLAAALYNMWVGVSQAGYSVAEELPIFLLIFAVPAIGAAFVWWKYS
jgi:hypothetical protein